MESLSKLILRESMAILHLLAAATTQNLMPGVGNQCLEQGLLLESQHAVGL